MLTIFTDTDTDIQPKEAEYYGYKLISMPYIIDNKEVKPYVDFDEFDYHSFYNTLRKGVLPTTCAISTEAYREYFESILTFNAMNIVVEELKEKYPERKFYTIDTKGITILSLIIVKEIGKLYKSGASITEIMDWADKNVDHFATYFFADTLNFFAKSGRVSNFSKVMGNLIGVKPIIYMDANGTMTNIGKERGRMSATKRLIQYY